MKRLMVIFTVLTLMGASLYATAVELPDFKSLAKRYSPAVVNISTRQHQNHRSFGLNMPDLPDNSPLQEFFEQFFGDQDNTPNENLRSRSLGSGFFISPDGYILTNYHVVNEADEIIVRTNDRREFEAKIIGSDRRSDTAVIKVDIKNAPIMEIGSTKNLEVGAWVLAIGSPFGFDHSVTQGIVSALGRSLPSENYVPFIQTDVAINPGNSGGPLLDLQGKVVGINSQIYSRTGGFMGLSFAVPIDLAMNVAKQIQLRGHVSRGWLGVMIQDVSRDLAEAFGMSNPRGALVVKVLEDSPAAQAKLMEGDIIIAYNDYELPTSAALPPLVGTSPVDRPSTLLILRDGKEQQLKITIGELPEEETAPKFGYKQHTDSAQAPSATRLGLAVRDLTRLERKRQGLMPNEGAIIEAINRGVARDAGLKVGDIILMFDGMPVRNGAAGLRKQIEMLPKGESVAILVQRDDDRLFLAMRLP